MTPERSQSPVELSNSEPDPTAPTTSTNNQIRVKDVSEINSNEAEASPVITKKRKLPSWMLVGSSNNKKTRIAPTNTAQLPEENESSNVNGEMDSAHEVATNGDSVPADAAADEDATSANAENPESTHGTAHNSISHEADCNSAEDALTSSTSISAEPTCSAAQSVSNDEFGPSTSEASCSSAQKPVKQEPSNDNEASGHTVGHITLTSPKDIKPAVKVEKEEATSSTIRESCKYGIRCYRRNQMHRIEEAHPGDKDYRRPDFPAPPDGTPLCPFGDLCYRRNPTHFQQFSHPPSTDFEKNWKNYKLRLRQRNNPPPVYDANSSYSDLDDDYDLNDPFIDDNDLDEEFIPSQDIDDDDFDE